MSQQVPRKLTQTTLEFNSVPTQSPAAVDSFPPQLQAPFEYHASPVSVATTAPQPRLAVDSAHHASPVSAKLWLQTDGSSEHQSHRKHTHIADDTNPGATIELQQTTGLPIRSLSVRSALSVSRHPIGSHSPASALSSPGLGPIIDITPLPSPVTPSASPRKWKRARDILDSQASRFDMAEGTLNQSLPLASSVRRSVSRPRASTCQEAPSTKNAPIYEMDASNDIKSQNLTECIPHPPFVPRDLNIPVSGRVAALPEEDLTSPNQHLHREEYLAVKRGLTMPTSNLPTPPRSTGDTDGSEVGSTPPSSTETWKKSTYYQARSIHGGKLRQWRELRKLGEGTFSTVVLAVREDAEIEDSPIQSIRVRQTAEECRFNPKSLVAVKICEHGPAGGADAARIRSSLTRELEILKAIDHPSLVHLKADNVLENQTYMVLDYCAGGDLYDLAFNRPDLLTSAFIRRAFAELVAAVQHLHSQYIVHRDIKLENILVNIPLENFPHVADWQTHPSPIVTLTDLGLGRYIPRPPESPLLETRCGSEDYAAPELLLGQAYDGRATDAWALGVLLYALMEQRLPFDQLPNSKRKSQKTHRIARCEWGWHKFGQEDGEWDPVKGEAWGGAKLIVEGLLARSRNRWSLDKVEEADWVRKGMILESPLRREDADEDDDDER